MGYIGFPFSDLFTGIVSIFLGHIWFCRRNPFDFFAAAAGVWSRSFWAGLSFWIIGICCCGIESRFLGQIWYARSDKIYVVYGVGFWFQIQKFRAWLMNRFDFWIWKNWARRGSVRNTGFHNFRHKRVVGWGVRASLLIMRHYPIQILFHFQNVPSVFVWKKR